MTTKIFEELPSRDNRPVSSSPGPTDMKAKMEKRVRQAVYDIRYRARREGIDIKQAYSQYMQNSSLNGQERNLVKAKIFGGRTMAEDYNIEEFAANSVAKVLFKVFVEGLEKEEPILGEEYLQELKNLPDKKYKVRVTDKNGTSYVRYATRDKISDLRANPNIESVEMTEYGEPYEGERKGGKQTAKAQWMTKKQAQALSHPAKSLGRRNRLQNKRHGATLQRHVPGIFDSAAQNPLKMGGILGLQQGGIAR